MKLGDNISAANKGRSTVNYRQFAAFDRPYLSCNYHHDRWVFQGNLFYYSFQEILLDNLEVIILKFKHFYKNHRTSLLSFYLFIFYSLFCNHSVYYRSPSVWTFPLPVITLDESALFLHLVS